MKFFKFTEIIEKNLANHHQPKNLLMMKLVYLIFILILLLGCNAKKKENVKEDKIITTLLPAIIDSTCMDLRIYEFPPPMPKSIYDKNNKFIGFDSSHMSKDSALYQSKLDSLDNDTGILYLGFDPVLNDVEERHKNELFSHFKIKVESVTQSRTKLKIPYKNILTGKKFKLEISSKIPKINKSESIFRGYGGNFSGYFSISRIYFDKGEKFGVLTAAYLCGSRCGQGYTIFIKKVNNKWIIDEIEETWIA